MSHDALEKLAADREIRRQLHHYCRAVDRLDVELLRSVWHPDGTLDFEEPALVGPVAELGESLIEWYGGWAAHCVQVSNVLIEVRGDRAVSEAYTLDVLRAHPDGAGGVVDRHRRGRYVDRWSRRDGRWAIDRRQVLEAFVWEQPVVEGSIGERSRRDRSDPVYDVWAWSFEAGEEQLCPTA